MDFFSIVPDKKKGRCCVRLCRKKADKSRLFCRRCRDNRYKIKNPEAYTYGKIRWNAKQRKIEFTITLEEFKKFCTETGYLSAKGRSADSMSLDRKDDSIGYTIDNIQVLSVSDNSKKYHEDHKPIQDPEESSPW